MQGRGTPCGCPVTTGIFNPDDHVEAARSLVLWQSECPAAFLRVKGYGIESWDYANRMCFLLRICLILLIRCQMGQ